MTYREILPAPALRPFVDRFWTRTSSGAAREGASLILPDGCLDVIARLDRGGEARVVGAMSCAQVIPPLGEAQVVAVRFRPGGAAAMLQLDAATLTDRAVRLAELDAPVGGSRGARQLEALLEPRGAKARGPRACDRAIEQVIDRGVAALERWLLGRLPSIQRPDPLIAHAIGRLFGGCAPSVSELARELGTSRQHLRRLFLRHVGIAPKELGRIARLQRAVAHLQRFPELALARAAAHLGYFDQAHLARELRLLTGISATAVRAQAGSILPIHSLLTAAD